MKSRIKPDYLMFIYTSSLFADYDPLKQDISIYFLYLLLLEGVGTRSRLNRSFKRFFSFSFKRFNMKPTPFMFLEKHELPNFLPFQSSYHIVYYVLENIETEIT